MPRIGLCNRICPCKHLVACENLGQFVIAHSAERISKPQAVCKRVIKRQKLWIWRKGRGNPRKKAIGQAGIAVVKADARRGFVLACHGSLAILSCSSA